MRADRGDRGDSLVEILAALVVLSIGVVGLLTALATHASTTVVNRSQAQASTLLLAAAEHVKSLPYAACGPSGATAVTTAALPHDPLFTITYGPGRALDGSTPCAELTVVPVRVVGDGFDLSSDVVKRP